MPIVQGHRQHRVLVGTRILPVLAPGVLARDLRQHPQRVAEHEPPGGGLEGHGLLGLEPPEVVLRKVGVAGQHRALDEPDSSLATAVRRARSPNKLVRTDLAPLLRHVRAEFPATALPGLPTVLVPGASASVRRASRSRGRGWPMASGCSAKAHRSRPRPLAMNILSPARQRPLPPRGAPRGQPRPK
jgi:hypothetical protein